MTYPRAEFDDTLDALQMCCQVALKGQRLFGTYRQNPQDPQGAARRALPFAGLLAQPAAAA